MAEAWITIPNWDKFQHYKDRTPAWIKLYVELRDKDEWCRLTLAQRGLLVSIWIEYGASRGILRASDIPRKILQKFPRKSLDALNHAGFIVLSASKPLARAREEERREEKERAGALTRKTPNPEFERGPLPVEAVEWMHAHGISVDSTLKPMDLA